MSRIKTARRRCIRTQLPQVCAHCAATEALTIDHIIPRVYGGTNALANLQMLCFACHRQKTTTEVRYHNPAKNRRRGHELAQVLAKRVHETAPPATTPPPPAPVASNTAPPPAPKLANYFTLHCAFVPARWHTPDSNSLNPI